MIKLFYKPYLYYNLFIRHKIIKKRKTYSQFQEDLFISNYFKNNFNGFYVDVGCYHPLKYSNTALMHNRGWKGLNIDINQTSIDLFNIARPKDLNICAALSNTNETSEFYFDHKMSPVNTLNKEFSDYCSKKISFNKFSKIKIQKYKFDKLVEQYNLTLPTIDFVNIDVEAHDLEVLEGFNLLKYKPKLICIELYNSKLELIEQTFSNFLTKLRYKLIKKIGPNGFFQYND